MSKLIINKDSKKLYINPLKGKLLIREKDVTSPSKMFVGAVSNEMYYSLDGGNNWQQFDFGTYASSVNRCGWTFFSKDGNYGVTLGYISSDVAWLTIDGGNTWNVFSTVGDSQNRFSSLSNDGKYILTGGFNNSAGYISTNYGSSFSRTGANKHLWSAMSGDGKYMFVVPPNGYYEYYYSHDYGSTWTTVSLPGTHHKVCDCDESGQYFGVSYAAYGTGIWFSDDYGQTITKINSNDGNIYISNDATQISYWDEQGSKIHTSVDKGNTWNNFTTPYNGLYSNIRVAKTQNRTFFINSQDSKMWEVTNDGNSYTQIFDFSTLGGSNVRLFECGDNEILLSDTNKKLFKCSYDDVTDWQHIYTYPGSSTGTYISIK